MSNRQKTSCLKNELSQKQSCPKNELSRLFETNTETKMTKNICFFAKP